MNDCLELEAYFSSNIPHNIYKLDGEVPKTVNSSETSYISPFCELKWFKLVIFWDEAAPLPDDVLNLGHNLELSVDVGPAMTTKIFTENVKVLHRST